LSTTVSSGVWQCGPAEMLPKFLLIAIADNADDFGFAFPSQDTLAQKICCDNRTVMRRLEQLEAQGWLTIYRKAVHGRANAYLINLAKIGVTVSPAARQSPLFTRVLRMLGDTESPIHPPEGDGDTDAFSGDFPQPRQVTKPAAQVTATPAQVTLGHLTGDTRSHPNRKEPPREPSGEPSVSEPPNEENRPRSIDATTMGDGERFGRMKLELKDLFKAGTPLAAENVSTVDAYERCFRDWWLVRIEPGDTLTCIVTEAACRKATVRGLVQHQARVRRAAATAFGLSGKSFSFRVLERAA
jgi:hypothetical protein